MAGFSQGWMSELLAKNDIVSIVSEQNIQLKQKGRSLWGNCPFHGEKTPSFSVSPDKQAFYCFGCHAGGGVIQFVMDIERISYLDAVKWLAERAKMELPDKFDDAELQKKRAEREKLYEACTEAARFFYERLKSSQGAGARQYLCQRGLTNATITSFGLGYSPQSWDALLNHMNALGFENEILLKAGLINQKEGRYFDSFRGRVMFPIIGAYNKVIGFGARAMGDEKPKYLNSPETPIFNKRMNLFGLNRIKGRKLNDILLVEGYMDVISVAQAGADNIVASLGTALTENQAKLIKNVCSNAYICYDGDFAGQNAALKAIEVLSQQDVNVFVMILPKDIDPDDLAKKSGLKGIDELKGEALTMHQFRLSHMRAGYDFTKQNNREEYAKKACEYLANLSPIEQQRYLLWLSGDTGYSIEVLNEQIMLEIPKTAGKKNIQSNYRNTKPQVKKIVNDKKLEAQRILMRIAILSRNLLSKIDKNLLDNQWHIELFEELFNGRNIEEIFNEAQASDEGQKAAEIAAIISIDEPENILECLKGANEFLNRHSLLEQIAALQEQAEQPQADIKHKIYCASKIKELNTLLNSDKTQSGRKE